MHDQTFRAGYASYRDGYRRHMPVQMTEINAAKAIGLLGLLYRGFCKLFT